MYNNRFETQQKIKVYLKLYNKQMFLSEQQALTKYREDIRMIRGMKQNVVCVFIMCNLNNSYSIYLENEKWVLKEKLVYFHLQEKSW